MKALKQQLSVLDLFYPESCAGCAQTLYRGEDLLCVTCQLSLPLARMHDMELNVMEMRLLGRFDFKAATSLLFFSKQGRVQHMMHQLKYEGHEELGLWMGRYLAEELHASTRFSEIGHVVPVPLHPRKLKSRGYNQSEVIARGMEDSGFVTLPDTLRRVHDNASQTRKSMTERWENVQHVFELGQGQNLEGQKVLLLDDVLTTGATLEACARQLLKIAGIELYVATIACAEY